MFCNAQNNPQRFSDLHVVMPRRAVTEPLPCDRVVLTARKTFTLQATARGDAVNDFDDWNRAETLVKHLLMTQPGLIFSASLMEDDKTVESTSFAIGNREPSECPGTIGLANRS